MVRPSNDGVYSDFSPHLISFKKRSAGEQQAMLSTTAAEAAVAAGKVKAVVGKNADVGDGTDGKVEAPTKEVVARPRLLVAMAAAPKPEAEVPQWASVIDAARRAIGGATARQTFAADAKDEGTLSMPASRQRNIDGVDAKDEGKGTLSTPAPRPRNIDAVDATDGGTLLTPAPHLMKKLPWRWRVRMG